MKSQSVADIDGPWVDPTFESGLIQRCRQFWNVPVEDLPNDVLALYLRQRIALSLIIPEARKRVDSGIDDGTELRDGELVESLRDVKQD